mmetsp:Transcript_56000/g.67221  ORF Transcript_56000/g.67221 Transcript_56000/m.67221 type:complete len:200 (+) Transcript_56000:111-710(+)|eukprot:CAMPEP_0172502590 /NCGR_PEP_ID=MMETSP1066-20121228/161239_1 /TAXON_ID=671091 /ORGANISM="Coscinodiscus wailesii, Strain CCMP2513" /LENGTH=199 /DNA_ID=CAMNT_0013277895 /DNA_START=91 /DNA_END=690 /DNA_ORIENTATION=+
MDIVDSTSTITQRQESSLSSPGDDNQSSAVVNNDECSKSALQHNIDNKGRNAYYYAHAHKADGPKWDGNIEPKLLSRQASVGAILGEKKLSSFDYHKSNITSYAFSDENSKIKIYVSLPGVGDKCQNEHDITLEYTSFSFSLKVKNYSSQEQCLYFGKLYGGIESAHFRKKKDKVILTLVKSDVSNVWPRIGASNVDTE